MTTIAILVLVMFFVYPLKYLFTLITVLLFGFELDVAPSLDGRDLVQSLYLIYGLGYAGIWGLYAVLYCHALAMRQQLQLNDAETNLTYESLGEYLIYAGVSLLSVTLALVTTSTLIPGLIYFLLAPLQAFNGWWFGRRLTALAATGA
jgi:hypothetical protein